MLLLQIRNCILKIRKSNARGFDAEEKFARPPDKDAIPMVFLRSGVGIRAGHQQLLSQSHISLNNQSAHSCWQLRNMLRVTLKVLIYLHYKLATSYNV